MRLPFVRSPSSGERPTPPPSPLARVEARLVPAHYARHHGTAAERRPLLWRHGSAPASVERHRADQEHSYFSFPVRRPESGNRVTRWLGAQAAKARLAADEVQEEVEAGCFRLAVQAATWWLWHRWRRR